MNVTTLTKNMLKKIEMGGKLIKTKKEYNKWINILNKNISLIRKKIRQGNDGFTNNFKLESHLALIKCYREKFKIRRCLNHNSNNNQLKASKQNLIWQDVESCFDCRIQTGAIINLKIKDPVFLIKHFVVFPFM